MEHRDMYQSMIAAWAIILAAGCLTTVYALAFDYGLKPFMFIRRVVGRLRLR